MAGWQKKSARHESEQKWPDSRADFIAYIEEIVDKKAGAFHRQITRQLEGIDASFFSMEGIGNPVNFLNPYLSSREIQEDAAYWYLKPAIMARVEEPPASE